MQKFVPRSRIRNFHNERTRSTPLDPKLMVSHVLYCLIVFGTVLSCYETWFKMGRTGAINPSLCHEVVSEFSATNAPDPPHWTLNSWFGAFHTLWVHFGQFHCLTKLGSKRAELVQLIQKLKPRSRVKIFGNERTRSTPLDPKLMVWHISYYLIAFGTILSRYETRFKTGQPSAINAKVRATKSRQNFSKRALLIHTIGQ